MTAIPESPLLHPRSMTGEIQLRVPPTSHRLEHQDTIIVADDETDSPAVNHELMATSPPRPNIHNLDCGDATNENMLQSNCASSGISSGLSQANGGPLSDTSNSNIGLSVSSSPSHKKSQHTQGTPPLPATGTASKHHHTTSASKINPNEKVMFGELVVLG